MEVLRMGARGPSVELLQTALQRADFFEYAIDGVFGRLTQDSVIRFQMEKGLVADGVVGNMTWSELLIYIMGYVTHRIQPGDTLYNLARQFGSSPEAIITANPGLNPDNLIPGAMTVIPMGFKVVPTNISFTYDLMKLCLDGIKARYPFIRISVIGQSVLGKSIFAIEIGNGSNRIMYNASHHGNEWITSTVLTNFIEQYAAVYSGLDLPMLNCIAKEMYEKTTIYFVPMVNPDGVDLVTGVYAPGSEVYEKAREMNYLRDPFPSSWKANIRGVDLNLNYPAGWETARDIKYAQGYVRPGPRNYVGPYPLSEPESIAMAELTRNIGFSLTLSYHTQGEVIYWRYLDYLPPRSFEIAKLFSRVSGYLMEETPYESGYAGFKDWFIQEFGKPGYTIECGYGTNPLPIAQFGRIYRDNIGILAIAALL